MHTDVYKIQLKSALTIQSSINAGNHNTKVSHSCHFGYGEVQKWQYCSGSSPGTSTYHINYCTTHVKCSLHRQSYTVNHPHEMKKGTLCEEGDSGAWQTVSQTCRKAWSGFLSEESARHSCHFSSNSGSLNCTVNGIYAGQRALAKKGWDLMSSTPPTPAPSRSVGLYWSNFRMRQRHVLFTQLYFVIWHFFLTTDCTVKTTSSRPDSHLLKQRSGLLWNRLGDVESSVAADPGWMTAEQRLCRVKGGVGRRGADRYRIKTRMKTWRTGSWGDRYADTRRA